MFQILPSCNIILSDQIGCHLPIFLLDLIPTHYLFFISENFETQIYFQFPKSNSTVAVLWKNQVNMVIFCQDIFSPSAAAPQPLSINRCKDDRIILLQPKQLDFFQVEQRIFISLVKRQSLCILI